MKTRLAALAMALFASFAAISAVPSAAAAQCKWGCMCEGNACGCNSRGSGGSCATGGDGCVVSGCMPLSTTMRLPHDLEFTPDGSVVVQSMGAQRSADARSLLFASFAPAAAPGKVQAGGQALDGRWEYVAPGRAVARHCSGMIVAHYFDRDAAEAARSRSRLIRI